MTRTPAMPPALPLRQRSTRLRVIKAVEAVCAVCAHRVEALPVTSPSNFEDLLAMVLLASRAHLPGREPRSTSVACDVSLARHGIDFDFTNPVGRLLILGAAARWLSPHVVDIIGPYVERALVREKQPRAKHERLRAATARRLGSSWQELEDRRAQLKVDAELIREQLAPLLPEGHSLKPHQLEGIVQLQDRDLVALLSDDQGLGKTITALAAALLEGRDAFPMVVVCPASVVGTWALAARVWLQVLDPCVVMVDRHFQGADTEVAQLEGALERLRARGSKTLPHPAVRRLRQRYPEGSRRLSVRMTGGFRWKRKSLDPERPLVVVTSWAMMLQHLEALEELRPKMIVGDEFHEQMSVHTSTTTKAFWTLRRSAVQRLMLSGTPLPNGRPRQLFAAFKALDKRCVPDFGEYGSRWCGPKKKKLGKKWVTSFNGRTNRVEFGRLLAKHQVRRIKAELPPGSLPAKSHFGIRARLSDLAWMELAAARDEVRLRVQLRAAELRETLEEADELDAEAIDEKIKAVLGSETVIALGRLRVKAGIAKVPTMVELVRELHAKGERPLIFCEHHEVVDVARKALEGHQLKVLTGTGKSGSSKQRDRIIATWQAGTGDVMIITRAFTSGVTLTSGAVGIRLERYWVPGHEHQADDRLHRYTQERDVSIYVLHAAGTPDDAMVDLSTWKEEGISELQGSAWKRVMEWLLEGRLAV